MANLKCCEIEGLKDRLLFFFLNNIKNILRLSRLPNLIISFLPPYFSAKQWFINSIISTNVILKAKP